jgi:hypothetical protein
MQSDGARMTEFDQRTSLHRLLDRQDILDCVYRYARGVDRHDRELILSAYHGNAVHTRGDFSGSPEEFADWVHARHTGRSRRQQHHITNHTIDFSGPDVAYGETYYIATAVQESGSHVVVVCGRYIDRFERRDAGWRIAERVVVREWHSTSPVDELIETLTESTAITWDRSDISYRRPLETG